MLNCSLGIKTSKIKIYILSPPPTTVQLLFGQKKNLFTIDAPPGVSGVSKKHILFFTNETVFLLHFLLQKSFKIYFDYFVTVAPPGGFFTLMKMLPNVIKKMFLSVLSALLDTISKFLEGVTH